MSFDNAYGRMLAKKIQAINERKIDNMGDDVSFTAKLGKGFLVDDPALTRTIGGARLNRALYAWDEDTVTDPRKRTMIEKGDTSMGRPRPLEASGLFSDVLGSFGLGEMQGSAMAFGKKRGRPKKQTAKDKEDEKLAMKVKGLQSKLSRGLTGSAEIGYNRTGGEDMQGSAMAFGAKKGRKKKGQGILSDVMGSFGLGQMQEGSAMAFGAKKGRKKKGEGMLSDIVGSFGLGESKANVGFDPNFVPTSISGKTGQGVRKLVPVQSMKGNSMSGFGKADGRKKRAEIVKQVMNDKGLSMIEASKYVKTHNLY